MKKSHVNLKKKWKECEEYKISVEIIAKKKADDEVENMTEAHNVTVKKLRRKQYYLTKKNKKLNNVLGAANLSFFVNKILKGMHFEKRASLVLDMVISGDMFSVAGKTMGKMITKEVRKVFAAWRLCKAKDTACQRCLNLQGIKAVRCTQELEDQEEGFITSKSSVWREGDELLRKVAYLMFNPTHLDNQIGEICYLDFEKVARYVLEVHGLTRIASIFSVEIAFSIDAAALTEGTSHIFAACKNIDPQSQKMGNYCTWRLMKMVLESTKAYNQMKMFI